MGSARAQAAAPSLHDAPLRLPAAARGADASVPSIVADAPRAHNWPMNAVGDSTGSARFEHDFGRLSVHDRAKQRVQPKLFISARGDCCEQEADAVAEHVMRMPDEQPSERITRGTVLRLERTESLASGFESIQRQPSSPYSIDEGVLVEGEGEQEGGSLQAKLVPGPRPVVAPGVAGRIQALRAQGAPLSAPVRGFMEARFGHDFGMVRVHTGSAASEVAARMNARAFTIGRDIVFGDGQFALHSDAGKRLIAHELTHVIQQGHAPRLPQTGIAARSPESGTGLRPPHGIPVLDTDSDSGVIRRVKWQPNKPTGKSSSPWGSGGPSGKVLKAQTDAGTPLDIWRPDDGKTYWCHGYTFGGMSAKGGPYSVWGSDVTTVLKDDGWQQTYSCMAQPADILVFWNTQNMLTHSGIIRKVSASGARVDDATSTLESKWGSGSHNTSTWETNAKGYGKYRCYSKSPLTGVCSGKGANEL